MNAYSKENVAKALKRIPATDSKGLRAMLERASAKDIDQIVGACENELALRGPVELDLPTAQRNAEWCSKTVGLALTDTICVAFSEHPANRDEIDLLILIANAEEISHRQLVAKRGKGDIALIIGHLIYERFGFFRRFIEPESTMSDLLFIRGKGDGSVTYRLTPEAREAFTSLELI